MIYSLLWYARCNANEFSISRIRFDWSCFYNVGGIRTHVRARVGIHSSLVSGCVFVYYCNPYAESSFYYVQIVMQSYDCTHVYIQYIGNETCHHNSSNWCAFRWDVNKMNLQSIENCQLLGVFPSVRRNQKQNKKQYIWNHWMINYRRNKHILGIRITLIIPWLFFSVFFSFFFPSRHTRTPQLRWAIVIFVCFFFVVSIVVCLFI